MINEDATHFPFDVPNVPGRRERDTHTHTHTHTHRQRERIVHAWAPALSVRDSRRQVHPCIMIEMSDFCLHLFYREERLYTFNASMNSPPCLSENMEGGSLGCCVVYRCIHIYIVLSPSRLGSRSTSVPYVVHCTGYTSVLSGITKVLYCITRQNRSLQSSEQWFVG